MRRWFFLKETSALQHAATPRRALRTETSVAFDALPIGRDTRSSSRTHPITVATARSPSGVHLEQGEQLARAVRDRSRTFREREGGRRTSSRIHGRSEPSLETALDRASDRGPCRKAPPRPSATALAVARAFTEVLRRKEWAAVAPKDCPQTNGRVARVDRAGTLDARSVPAVGTDASDLTRARSQRPVEGWHAPLGAAQNAGSRTAFAKQSPTALRSSVCSAPATTCLPGESPASFRRCCASRSTPRPTQREKYKALLALSRSHGPEGPAPEPPTSSSSI
jgi:hypothetical protein